METDGIQLQVKSAGIVDIGVEDKDSTWNQISSISMTVKAENRNVLFKWEKPDHESLNKIILKAKGENFLLDITLSVSGNLVHIQATLRSDRIRTINFFKLDVDFLPNGEKILFNKSLDDCHIPHLVPEPGYVMADMIFRSPAILVREKKLGMALLPDLSCLGNSRTAPWALDFDHNGPNDTTRLSLSVINHSLKKHVYFAGEPEQSIELPDNGLTLSGHVILSHDAGNSFAQQIQHFLWKTYGNSNYKAVKPQVLPFDDLAKEAMDRLFKRDDLYFEFDYKGKKLAGVAAHAATTQRELKPLSAFATKLMSPAHGLTILLYLQMLNAFSFSRRADSILRWTLHKLGIPFIAEAQFTSWFNCLRTAYGARCLAEKWDDERLKEQTDRIRDLILAAPEEKGIFSSVCTAPAGMVEWKKGTLSFKAIDDYHIPDQATTGYLMLRWYRDIEKVPALLERARGLGRFLIQHQLSSGAVPAWINGKTHRPMKRLMESASTACPMMFLSMLAQIDEDEEALHAAKKMAAFMEQHVLPEHKWYDYETFFSCSKQRKNPRDPRSLVLPQNSMSKCWATEGMRILYEITGETRYRDLLLRCLGDLLWHQQIWDAPYLSINTFGGFGAMNTDAEWNDARQGMIAPVLMDSYLATGDPDHFERGVAALRSCYTTMLHPALKEVAPGNLVHYRETDRGAIYENYAHLGFDRVIAGYLEPDWGAGTAAFATAHAAKFYGDVFVDLDHNHAFGINGCEVKNHEIKNKILHLEMESKVPDLLIQKVVAKGADKDTTIKINGTDHKFEHFSMC